MYLCVNSPALCQESKNKGHCNIMFKIKNALILSLTLMGMFLFSWLFVLFPVILGMNMIIVIRETLTTLEGQLKKISDTKANYEALSKV